MNGYFQLEVKENGVYMNFIPPEDGGTQFAVEDAIRYLDFHNILGYNLVEIKRMMDKKAAGKIFLTGAMVPVSSEEVFLEVSEDKMSVTACFYPPFKGGNLLDARGIESTLHIHGVKFGIMEEVIENFLANREYCTPVVIAKGQEPTLGKDARIEYHFDTELRAKPQLNEDGSVDFHKLNSISHVHKGDVLATLYPEERGKEGYNVLGGPIPPRDVKKQKLSFGKNISYAEDKLSIVSDVDGHVSLVDDKVFVSDTYEVPADVDASTGDIEYQGNIEVRGCVRTGFALRCNGNIMVNGVVEGATLIADGDIVLKCGIQGMGRGILQAGGNIVTKFIENANAKAGGNITAEAILHSHVEAQNSILVTGRKGFITGGKVYALSTIEAKTIGSTMGADTLISVGIDPEEKERIQFLMTEKTRLQKEIIRLDPVVKRFKKTISEGGKISQEQLIQVKTIVQQYQGFQQQYKNYDRELEKLLEHEVIEKDSKIVVKDRIYPGVKLVISDCRYIVKDEAQYCQFKRQGVDVKMSGL